MKLALVQCPASKDVQANVRRGLERLREAAERGAKLVCYPELAFTPFFPQRPASGDIRALAEPIPGPIT
ncbi:MAG TPA: nitrilase-related carbon-nitrogen hydrolase, partial [Planctomycetota bacterium]|nr:nitrilase-related carbon-nitrogen hydrolase [Planctomycetota bacterium]